VGPEQRKGVDLILGKANDGNHDNDNSNNRKYDIYLNS